MHEVRVESLDKLESSGGRMLLSAKAGSLSIVFPQVVWEDLLAGAPTAAELAELARIRDQLEGFAEEETFGSVLGEAPCGDSGLPYDLILRPSELFAMTTGYFFAPVVDSGLVARIGTGLGDDGVEQAYIVGAVTDEEALLSSDENLGVLSVRGRSCSTSRVEMPPELWQVLSGRLGRRDVYTITTRR